MFLINNSDNTVILYLPGSRVISAGIDLIQQLKLNTAGSSVRFSTICS